MAPTLTTGIVLRPCATQPCRELVEHGRCAKHEGDADRWRGTAASRGYDGAWQRFRSWFIARHPLCADCQEQHLVVATEEVHHVLKVAEHPELRLVESNCRGLCKTCHSKRTAKGE